MNISKLAKTISVIIVVLLLFVIIDNFYVRDMHVDAFRGIIAITFDELVSESDLIIQGKILPNKENKLITSDSGETLFGYTITDIEIEKVLKGNSEDDIILVTEEYFIVDNIIGKSMMLQDAYLPAKIGSSYILFLKKYDEKTSYKGMYYPIDLEYGKYLINDKVKEGISSMSKSDLEVGESAEERYYDWMELVLAKYVH